MTRIFFLMTLLMVGSVRGDEPWPVLDAAADAVASAISNLREGEMDFTYSSYVKAYEKPANLPSASRTSTQGKVLWKDTSLYASYVLDKDYTTNPDSENSSTLQYATNGPNEIIRTPTLYCEYVKNLKWCRHQTHHLHHSMNADHQRVLEPRVAWFSTAMSRKHNHVGGLSWRLDESDKDLTVVKDVASAPRQKLIVRQTKGFEDRQSSYLVDYDQGGLVTEAWLRGPKQNSEKITCQWQQDEYGVWYAREWQHIVYEGRNTNRIVAEETAEITRFSSRVTVPANRFEFSSLKLPSGTRLEQITAQGKKYSFVGGKGPEPAKFNLDSLIDDVQDGFAAPKNK